MNLLDLVGDCPVIEVMGDTGTGKSYFGMLILKALAKPSQCLLVTEDMYESSARNKGQRIDFEGFDFLPRPIITDKHKAIFWDMGFKPDSDLAVADMMLAEVCIAAHKNKSKAIITNPTKRPGMVRKECQHASMYNGVMPTSLRQNAYISFYTYRASIRSDNYLRMSGSILFKVVKAREGIVSDSLEDGWDYALDVATLQVRTKEEIAESQEPLTLVGG